MQFVSVWRARAFVPRDTGRGYLCHTHYLWLVWGRVCDHLRVQLVLGDPIR